MHVGTLSFLRAPVPALEPVCVSSFTIVVLRFFFTVVVMCFFFTIVSLSRCGWKPNPLTGRYIYMYITGCKIDSFKLTGGDRSSVVWPHLSARISPLLSLTVSLNSTGLPACSNVSRPTSWGIIYC